MSNVSTVTREQRATPARSIPNFIQDVSFKGSAPWHALKEAGGFEYLGIYQTLVLTCLSDPEFIRDLEEGKVSLVAKAVGVKAKKLLNILGIISGYGLANSNGNGFVLSPQKKRIDQFSKLSAINSANRSGSVLDQKSSESAPKPLNTKESEKGIDKRSANDSNYTLHTATTSISPTVKEGGLGETQKPVGPKALIQEMGEEQVSALRARFYSENLTDDDLREAFWHAAAKRTEDPDFHAYSWISRYGPQHARDASISKNKLATSQQIQKKTAIPKTDHPSFRQAPTATTRADPKVGALLGGLVQQMGAK